MTTSAEVRQARRRAERWPWIWAALFVLAVITAVAFGVAYAHGSAALARAQAVARCINGAIATRSVVGQRDPFLNGVLDRPGGTLVTDSDANRAVYRELNRLRAGRASDGDFFAASVHAQAVLDNNDAFRKAHPLGRCT